VEPEPRVASLVLTTRDGRWAGTLPPFAVDTPWWQEVEPVVRAARERHGVDVTVLRMLHASRERSAGGPVTYLAEVAAPVPGAAPAPLPADDHPLRMSWARPGGPAGDVAWAEREAAARGLRRRGPAVQVRTWNLSSLWRLPVDGETLWLKVVPPFFAHEGAVLERLAGRPVPRLVARDGPRLLLREVPGRDLWEAPVPLRAEMAALLVALQRDHVGKTDALRSLGLFDWRAEALVAAIASVVARTSDELARDDRDVLARFVDGLPSRLDAVAACGLPDTLVHGDFHGGNVRGDGASLVVLDWGDCGVGHPLLDEPALVHGSSPGEAVRIRRRLHDEWRRALPGCDPERASALLAPVGAARGAAVYRGFLDRIEPSEHPYHRTDPATSLRRTAGILRAV
jgi:hypothetical protein